MTMRSVHLVIPDLFLPKDIAAEVLADMSFPALQKILGRGQSEILEPVSLESRLCEMFGIPFQQDVPVAAISAAFDGLAAGCWLRADPVMLDLQRDQLLLNPVRVRSEEAAALCASLNGHFAGHGMEFFAPHPQRWYVRLEALPGMRTTPLSEAIGRDVRKLLPAGVDAVYWHQVFNEIQMLLHTHPINETRESSGEPTINSVWFWGGGCGMSVSLQKNYNCVNSDDVLPEMFAVAVGVPFTAWPEQWNGSLTLKDPLTSAPRFALPSRLRGERSEGGEARQTRKAIFNPWEQGLSSDGRQLLVWTGLRSALQRGDLAAWRSSLQDFEAGYAQPVWQALKAGTIDRLNVDVLGRDSLFRTMLTRGNTRAFWRRGKRLADYSLV